MVSLGATLSLAAMGVSASLAVYVLGVNPKGPANRACFVLMIAFATWDAFEAVQRGLPAGTAEADLLPYVYGVWIGIVVVPAALIHLALSYPEPARVLRAPYAVLAIYAPSVAWAYAIVRTDLILDGVSANAFGPSARVAPAYVVLAPLYAIWLYAGVALFVRAWGRSRRAGAGREQGIVASGLLLASIPSGVTEIFWPLLTPNDTRVGLGSLYTLTWSIFIAYSVVRYRYLEIEPVMEVRAPRAVRHALERGQNYLVVEPGRATAMGAFREIVSETPGLCVTGLPRSLVARRFGLERTPILWITTTSSGELTIRPSALEFEFVHAITKFLREHPGTAVLLDDLDYLAALNGFEAVARFVRRVTNQASASGGTAILAVGEGTFPPDHLAVLRGTVDHVLEVPHGSADLPSGDAGHVVLLVGSQEAPDALAAAGARGGLLLTTEHPSKARRRFGGSWQILWLAEGGGSDAPRIAPGAIDAEGRRALAQFIATRRGADIAIVGAEQLALYNDFPVLLGFLKDALDLAGAGGCRLFLTAAPESLPARHLAMILRRFDAPAGTLPGGVTRTLPSAPPTGAPESRILYRGPVS